MSANRYSSLNRRPGAASGSSLFADYPGGGGSRPSSSTSQNRPFDPLVAGGGRTGSPYTSSGPNPYAGANGSPLHSTFGAGSSGGGTTTGGGGFRPATPNSKGQYSASVLEELESQNENTQTSILSGKVAQLKQLTIAIGDEIRDSSSLAGTLNDSFENTGVRLRGTMRRMLRMAERTGVGWRVWLGFFVAVWLIFAYVWLF